MSIPCEGSAILYNKYYAEESNRGKSLNELVTLAVCSRALRLDGDYDIDMESRVELASNYSDQGGYTLSSMCLLSLHIYDYDIGGTYPNQTRSDTLAWAFQTLRGDELAVKITMLSGDFGTTQYH